MNSTSLCSLAGRYDNPIRTRFLAPIDCLKIQLSILFEYQEKFLSIDKALNFKVALIGYIFSHENQEPVGHNTFTEN
jgi:hypothetical protein